MSLDPIQAFAGAVLILGVAFLIARKLRFRKVRMQIPELLQAGAVIVDVRSRGEFNTGARKGSINIPLDELPRNVKKLDPSKPIILCCASGARSAAAEKMLRQQGFTQVVNAGSWSAIPA